MMKEYDLKEEKYKNEISENFKLKESCLEKMKAMENEKLILEGKIRSLELSIKTKNEQIQKSKQLLNKKLSEFKEKESNYQIKIQSTSKEFEIKSGEYLKQIELLNSNIKDLNEKIVEREHKMNAKEEECSNKLNENQNIIKEIEFQTSEKIKSMIESYEQKMLALKKELNTEYESNIIKEKNEFFHKVQEEFSQLIKNKNDQNNLLSKKLVDREKELELEIKKNEELCKQIDAQNQNQSLFEKNSENAKKLIDEYSESMNKYQKAFYTKIKEKNNLIKKVIEYYTFIIFFIKKQLGLFKNHVQDIKDDFLKKLSIQSIQIDKTINQIISIYNKNELKIKQTFISNLKKENEKMSSLNKEIVNKIHKELN